MRTSSSTSSSDARSRLLRTLGCLVAFGIVSEVSCARLAHPADLADIRIAQAGKVPDLPCLVLGDSVANQLAPPERGPLLRRWAVAAEFARDLPDLRGSAGAELDARCVFLTTTVGATRLGDLLLYQEARRHGMRPSEVHVVLSPGGWAAGREGNPHFEDGFTVRFSSAHQAWQSFSATGDAVLFARQVAVGILPSVGSRGPYGQRVLQSLVPRSQSNGESPRPALPVSDWNRHALRRMAEEVHRDGARLRVYLAPHPAQAMPADAVGQWRSAVHGLAHVSVANTPTHWAATAFRDGVHVHDAAIADLARWFAVTSRGE